VQSKTPPSRGIYEFVGFRLDVQERLLLRNGCTVSITPKIFDVLLVFLENPSRLLGKDEIMKAVWSDTHIDEATLTRTISELRKTLGEKAGEANFVQTVPKRGYRFVAPVEALPDPIAEESAAPQPISESTEPAAVAANAETRKVASRWVTPKATVGILFLGMLVVLAGIWVFEIKFNSPSPVPRSIAVLSFRHLGNGGDHFLELGIADTLITRLSGVPGLTVRPTSAVGGRSEQQDPVATGRILKVDTVLVGSVQTMLDQIRITLRLIRVQDSKLLWAATVDGNSTDLFSLQDSVSREVAAALKLHLSPNEKEMFVKRSTNNPEAYESYLKGRFFLSKRSPEGFDKASFYFQQAIRLDPVFAMAYAGLADTYLTLQGAGMADPQVATPKAKGAAQKALALDPTLGAAHNSLAAIAEDYDRDWPTAEKEFKLALALDPGFAAAHEWYGEYLGLMGRFDQGLAEVDRALEIDPLSPTVNEIKGKVLLWARRYDQAIVQFQKTLELDPSFSPARIWLVRTYAAKGMIAESLAESQKDNRTRHGATTVETLAMAYAAEGKRDDALRLLQDLSARKHEEYISPFNLAYVYLFLDEKDKAIKQLQIASEEHDVNVETLRVDPLLDALRGDPRFLELLKRVNLAS
jgi:DNA-binding winged helix-turn-helix (wHTH) protein/TolB-like protein